MSAFELASGGAGAVVMLSDTTLGADTASFDVQSISASYKHLQLVLLARGTTSATEEGLALRFNNDSGGNYDTQIAYGLGAGAGAFEALAGTSAGLHAMPAATAPASAFGMATILIPGYAETTRHKTGVAEIYRRATAVTGGLLRSTSGFSWRSTAAINRVTIFPGANNFLAASRLTIYGLN